MSRLPTRRFRLLAAFQATLVVASLFLPLTAPIAVLASTVSSATFTGGAGTASVSGTLYARSGASLTLTVVTSNDTTCVDVTGSFTVTQTSATAKTTWIFPFTAPVGDGLRSVTAAASPNINPQGKCTGQSQTPQNASFVSDNTGPTVAGVASPPPNAAGWNNANISITWSATDAGSGVGSGPNPATDSVTADSGGVTKTSNATDRVGNVGNGSITVKLDKTAPSISGSAAPAANANGWNNSDVTVSFLCSDALSGIKTCNGPTTLTGNGANQSVTGTATDNADNGNSATVSAINIDKVAPTLSGAPTTSPNAAGWYNSNVSIAWSCSDALSGILGSCPPNSTISSEGTGFTATISVSDRAANATTTTSSPAVKIDKTAPTTNANATSAWTNSGQTVTLTPSDALSGVKATHYTVDGGSDTLGTTVSITTEGDHLLAFWSEDNAGNAEAPKTVHVKVDLTTPSISHTQTPGPNGAGWNNAPVTVHFVCTDALSGIASCTPDQLISTEGANQAVTGTATDNAGNIATDPATVSIDLTAPVISASPDRVPNANGWYAADVIVSFLCSDALSGIGLCPDSETLAEGANQTASGTAFDAAGNSASASVTGLNVDETAPNLSGAATTTPNGAGWYQADVVIAWTCSDALSAIDGACATDSTITGEGANLSATESVSDRAGNSTTTTVSGIRIDRTAPATLGNVPDPLPTGWYAGAVPVTLTASDGLSGVAATWYTVDGGAPQAYATTFNFALGGTHTIVFWSVDKAGNVEDASAPGHSITLKIDDVVPSIVGSRSPLANTNGWNNTSVTVSFSCDDAQSGIASCTAPAVLSSAGAGQSVTGTAVDNAGNSATDTVSNVNIDLAAPVTTAAPNPDVDWANGSVQVSLNATDPLSGVAATYYDLDGGGPTAGTNVSIPTQGVHTLTFWSVDNADNVEVAGSATIKIDLTAPTISRALSPLPNAAGWNNSDVTVTFTCADQPTLSGVASCTSPSTVTAEGEGQTVNGTAVDNAGNESPDSATVNLDKTAPAITGSTDQAPNANGWYNADVLVSFTCKDTLSGIAVCEPPHTLGEAENQSVTGTATDRADNISTDTVANIDIDKTAPSLSGAPTTPANSASWYNADVAIHWICSDALSGIDGSCPPNSTISGEGVGLTEQATVSDRAGNATTATSSPAVNIDRTAPSTSADASGDWTNTDVSVTLEPSDGLSGVAATFSELDGDGLASGTTRTISGEGTFTLTYWSVDNAGNVETPNTVTIRIDRSAPSISHIQSPAANVHSWNNGAVTVTFTCADQASLSGIATCSAPVTVSTDGADQTVIGNASDNAGNTATDTAHVSIDTAAPTISGSADRAPNANGWYKADVIVSFSCGDVLSGLSSCSGPTTLGQGAGQTVTGTAVDNADNSAPATVGPINIDKTAPLISGAPTTLPNAAGWYQGDVVVHWTCSDALSGLDGACPADSTITGEGENLSATASVTDKAGNSSSATVAAIKIDRTAPVTTGAATPSATWTNGGVSVVLTPADNLSGVAATTYQVDGGSVQTGTSLTVTGQGVHTVTFRSTDGAGNVESTNSLTVQIDLTAPTIGASRSPAANAAGWNNSPVTVSFSCSDALSGIATCPANHVVNTSGAGQAATGTAVDNAGNTASATVGGINIDMGAPSVSVNGVTTGSVYQLGAVPATSCSATDGVSGLSAPCALVVTGGTANGVGAFTATASATDAAGNTSSTSVTYRVIYRFDSFLQPINDTAHQVGVDTSIFKAGSTVPVKFQLKRANGTVVQSNVLPAWLTPLKGSSTAAAVDETVYTDSATSGTTYRWDGSQYIFNWGTAKNQANFYWRIGVSLDDGQTYYVNIGLR